jgi:hypothetical protein
MATITRIHASRSERNELADERHHIQDLVRLRKILARHGATLDELRSYDAEIDRHRHDLARPYLAAA